VFSVLDLAGPALRLSVPISGNAVDGFVYDLTWFTWPTQALAAHENSVGRVRAFGIAAGANVLLFAAIGAFMGAVGRLSWALTAVSGAVLLWALFGAGYDLEFINHAALLVGLLFYAVPIVTLKHLGWLAPRRPPAAA
jgi:hypothetical protein